MNYISAKQLFISNSIFFEWIGNRHSYIFFMVKVVYCNIFYIFEPA